MQLYLLAFLIGVTGRGQLGCPPWLAAPGEHAARLPRVCGHAVYPHGVPLGGQYSATLHGAHTTPGMKHIHVYAGNNQVFAMNIDGSAHDRSHGTRIPNKVAKALSQRFPDFKPPPNNIIESAPHWIMNLFGS